MTFLHIIPYSNSMQEKYLTLSSHQIIQCLGMVMIMTRLLFPQKKTRADWETDRQLKIISSTDLPLEWKYYTLQKYHIFPNYFLRNEIESKIGIQEEVKLYCSVFLSSSRRIHCYKHFLNSERKNKEEADLVELTMD